MTLRARFEAEMLMGGNFEVAEVVGNEELSVCYEFTIQLVGAGGSQFDELLLLDQAARLVFEEDGVLVRQVWGIVHSVDSGVHSESGNLEWMITLVPRMKALALHSTSEVFQDMSLPELIADRLEAIGHRPGVDFETRLLERYPTREFVVQYKETHQNFVERQAEHMGVAYFFQQHDSHEALVFTDHPGGYVSEELRLPFRPRGEKAGVFDLRTRTQSMPNGVRLKDYNYRTPGVALTAESGSAGAETQQYTYGEHVKTVDEATALARIRSEELGWQRRTHVGRSSSPLLHAGSRLQIDHHPAGDRNLLVVAVEHRFRQAVFLFGGAANEAAYENSFRAIDVGVPFRPQRRGLKPHVGGVVTGIIEAAQAGQYAELDPEGRYRVRFLFDSVDRERGKASRPIRMSQPHAGPGYGFHFPLRDGVEVVLTCVEGDPDRPIISGAVPNPQTPSTVGAENGMRNVIRTGGGTEINIDDSEGSERFKISVPYGNTVFQLGAPNAPTPGIFLGTDNEIHVGSNEGMTFFDNVHIRAASPEITLNGSTAANVYGHAVARLRSGSIVEIQAPKIDESAAALHHIEAPAIVARAGAVWAATGGASASLRSDGSVSVSAPTVTVTGGGIVNIEGGTVNINGGSINVTGGVVDIKGGPIKLNA